MHNSGANVRKGSTCLFDRGRGDGRLRRFPAIRGVRLLAFSWLIIRARLRKMGAGHYLQRPTIDSSPTASRSPYAQRGGVQPPPISTSISMPLSRPRQNARARRSGFPARSGRPATTPSASGRQGAIRCLARGARTGHPVPRTPPPTHPTPTPREVVGASQRSLGRSEGKMTKQPHARRAKTIFPIGGFL